MNNVIGVLPEDRDAEIVVKDASIHITRPIALSAQAAANVLANTPHNQRADVMARLLDIGAAADESYRSTLMGRLWGDQMTTMYGNFVAELQGEFKSSADNVEGRMLRILQKHERDLVAWTLKLSDPTNDQALPKLAAEQMRKVTDVAIAQLNVMLADGDQSALGRWTDKILKQLGEVERNLLTQIVRKNAINSVGVGRGREFEGGLSLVLSRIAVATGCQVDRCSDRLGVQRTKHGDHIITLDAAITAGSTVRIAVEAKSRADGQRFSHQGVQRECALARANREASAAIFVAESREILPDSVAFGQIGYRDFFVEYDPDTADDLALGAALYLARAAALQDLKPSGPGPVDRLVARRLVAEIRGRVERRSRILAYHASATKAIHSAGKALDEDADVILSSLVKLDGLLIA